MQYFHSVITDMVICSTREQQQLQGWFLITIASVSDAILILFSDCLEFQRREYYRTHNFIIPLVVVVIAVIVIVLLLLFTQICFRQICESDLLCS